MSDDLIERLLNYEIAGPGLRREAADEIARLRDALAERDARIGRLTEALREIRYAFIYRGLGTSELLMMFDAALGEQEGRRSDTRRAAVLDHSRVPAARMAPPRAGGRDAL